MNKDRLRKEALIHRKSLPEPVYISLNNKVTQAALQLIKNNLSRCVHLFLPISKNKEVDTWPIYHYLIAEEPYTPVISRTHFKTNTLTHHPMTAEDALLESSYGIPEPVHQQVIDTTEIDLIFIPLLAFDLKGNRVGYGAGLYDRFLAQCKPDTLKVGLALSEPIQELIDINEFDIRLDLCINHEKIYDFR